jgi:hypothetical protein
MSTCVLHIGQPKTGTTSIQSTLFWGLRDRRFRLLSLDSYFGNRLLLTAFHDRPHGQRGVFLRGITPGQFPRWAHRSRAYLDRTLAASRRDGVTPIISAECVWGFQESELMALRRFILDRGFEPRVVAYLRPPFDRVESAMQQFARIGIADLWPRCVLRPPQSLLSDVQRIDAVFGRRQVAVFPFDQRGFPDRCVVRHFCDFVGIDLDRVPILRENGSLSLDAFRFLHAFNGAHPARADRTSVFVRRVILERALRDLPGRVLRLHESLQAPLLDRLTPELSALTDRLGGALPLTTVHRSPDAGLRDEAELFSYSPEALDWLARRSGQSAVDSAAGPETARQVARQLNRLAYRSPQAVVALARERAAIHCQRLRLKARMRI